MKKIELEQLIENIVRNKLNEASYDDFKSSDESPRRKVNKAISEINSNLLRIERLAKHASKLKNETNISTDNYWTTTKQKINKINERLTRLSNTIKTLGA